MPLLKQVEVPGTAELHDKLNTIDSLKAKANGEIADANQLQGKADAATAAANSATATATGDVDTLKKLAAELNLTVTEIEPAA